MAVDVRNLAVLQAATDEHGLFLAHIAIYWPQDLVSNLSILANTIKKSCQLISSNSDIEFVGEH